MNHLQQLHPFNDINTFHLASIPHQVTAYVFYVFHALIFTKAASLALGHDCPGASEVIPTNQGKSVDTRGCVVPEACIKGRDK